MALYVGLDVSQKETDVVLPHVILLPDASLGMLPALIFEGYEVTQGGGPLTSPISRFTACWRQARTRFCSVWNCRKV